MSSEKRIKEITDGADEVLRRIQNWLGDKFGGPVVPDPVAVACELAREVCLSGDIPQCCQELCAAIYSLWSEYQKYERRDAGAFRPDDQSPAQAFWKAADGVAKAREGSHVPTVEALEPIALLLKQGVTHDQIARHIYGRRGEGPFMSANGVPDIVLIEQEAATPGSVLKGWPNWVTPWAAEAAQKRQELLAGRLKAFATAATPRKYEDPGTIESMLKDGCYVQQIESGKGVSRADVLKVAAELGITPVDRPGYAAVREMEATDDAEPISAPKKKFSKVD